MKYIVPTILAISAAASVILLFLGIIGAFIYFIFQGGWLTVIGILGIVAMFVLILSFLIDKVDLTSDLYK